MTSTLYKTAVFALALACVACGDDDSDPPGSGGYQDATVDGSMDASDALDASDTLDANERDSNVESDGSIDKDSSSDPDGGDAGMCEGAIVTELDNPDSPFYATRVPLAALCGSKGCPGLQDYAEDFECTELADDASIEDFDFSADAGPCCFNWWIRSEGCGQVQYRSHMTWPRIYNFDAQTGQLIGHARLDDIGYEFGGCTDAAFLGGELLHDCPTVAESVCDRM
jgi:hypothetical protein